MRPNRFIPPLGPPQLTPQEQALADWRRTHLGPQEALRKATVKTAAELLPQVWRTLRLDQRRGDLEILRAWKGLIDPTITAHAQPTRLHGRTLFVSVDSSAWLCEVVRYRSREILQRLQHCFGADRIQKISFRLG